MKILITLLTIIFSAGCATTNQMDIATFESNPNLKLPPISVFMKRPSDLFRGECSEFDNKSVLNHCELNNIDLGKFRDEVKSSGIFQDVFYADGDVGYRILLTTGLYNREGGGDLGSAVIAGATLMLAPMIITANVKVEASLYWYEYELKHFSYDLPMEIRASLLTMNQDTDQDIAKSIASHVISDIQKEDLFSPELLSQSIQSSNYKADLTTPDSVSEYTKAGLNIYNHPFFGVQVRYLNELFNTDYADVFIYPVRSPEWENQKTILDKEMTNIRKDIELSQKENQLTPLNYDEVKFIQMDYGTKKVPVLFFEHEYSDTLSNIFTSRTYLTIKKDKFLKIRHTFIKDDAQKSISYNFAKELFNKISVPDESLFMAKIRKQWRDKSIL
jgi:hypothetical protein